MSTEIITAKAVEGDHAFTAERTPGGGAILGFNALMSKSLYEISRGEPVAWIMSKETVAQLVAALAEETE